MRGTLFIVIIFSLCTSTSSLGQSLAGKWSTIDPFTNKPSSVVEVYFNGGKLYGKLVQIMDVDSPEKAICQDCPEPWKNKPLIGLVVLSGLERNGKKWEGEKAFFSRKTKRTYDGAVWLDKDKLKIQIQLGPIKVSRKWVKHQSTKLPSYE